MIAPHLEILGLPGGTPGVLLQQAAAPAGPDHVSEKGTVKLEQKLRVTRRLQIGLLVQMVR